MKRIYLSLLPCLASLLASAQEPLNGDSLASDFRYLVKELAATHPDPYSGFGGKVFFYEQAFHLENELRRTPGTKQTFFDKVSIFLSNLQDEHTYLLPPTANQQANQRYLALEVRTIPDGIILQGIPETYKDLLGSRITTINGDSLEEVLARTAAIQASENLYDRYANLCRSMPTEHFLRQLFPEMKDNLHLSLLTPDGKSRGLTLPLLSRQEVQNTPMQHNNSWKAYTDKQLAYQFIDNDKQIMLININSIMARDNFEYMQKQGLKDLYRQIGFYYRDILKQDMPADTLQAIRQLPSLSEVFAHMLKEMKKKSNYVFLKNIFDCIEFKDEKSSFNLLQLENAAKAGLIDKKVYALGGMSLENLKIAKELGFGGVVICGDLWNRFDIHNERDFKELILHFEKLRKAIS